METQFDQEINQDMAEIDQELGISSSEANVANSETVEEDALEQHSEPILDENDESQFAENLEASPASGAQVEEVSQPQSSNAEEELTVQNEEELSEFLDDRSDHSFEKSAEVVSEATTAQGSETASEATGLGGESGESGGVSSEKEEVNEEFAGDDEIIEEDKDSQATPETESSDSESESQAADSEQNSLEAESEEETETIEDSAENASAQSVASGVEEPEHEEEELEPSQHDELEELSLASEAAETVEALSETSEFHEELKNAMENAIKDNPNAKTIMVIKYDKDDTHPQIQHVDVDDYKAEFYERQDHTDHKTVEEILTQSMGGGNGAEIKPALEGPILDEGSVSDKLKAEAETIIQPSEEAKNSAAEVLSGAANVSAEQMAAFENLSLRDAVNEHPHSRGHGHHQPSTFGRVIRRTGKEETKAEQISEQGAQAQDVYLSSHEKMHQALKLFAEHDALKRATRKIPKGVPSNIFFADLMGLSGVGEHKPSYNMIKFYGGLSEFHQHFADKAKRQVSFEDIDTLIGLLSDMNGIFTTIYDLLPDKEAIEGEKDSSPGKSVLDHAYSILRFYSQVRGFVNTVVFNRHLLVQDIRFIKQRVNDLHTDKDDMLYFYALDAEYLKIRSRGKRFSFDPKIEGFLKRIEHVSVGFGIDVKVILRSFFHFEKSVVFFDNDVRELAFGINVSTPLDAIRTVDKVIMFLVRVIEMKVEIFRSLANLKKSLENLGKYRSEIIDNLNGAEQLIHYYNMQEESAPSIPLGLLFACVLVLFRKD